MLQKGRRSKLQTDCRRIWNINHQSQADIGGVEEVSMITLTWIIILLIILISI